MKYYKEVLGTKVLLGTHENKALVIGADHRGYDLKQELIRHYNNLNIFDMGTDSPDDCDYPRISYYTALKVAVSIEERVGIGICGSGEGIHIPAASIPGIIATRCMNIQEAESARKHNNSNFLGLSADHTDLETAIKIIDTWLITPHGLRESEEKYTRRYVQTLYLQRGITVF